MRTLGLNTPATGTTVGFSNTSDETCPYTGSTSPDVYYCYTPASDHDLTVTLCESAYDTKTYVYDSSLQLVYNINEQPSCNDDNCSSSGGGLFRSRLDCVPVLAGQLYYVVVDGWGGDSGDYAIELSVTDPAASADLIPPCILECPANGAPENEPCTPGAPDDFNGGCNSPGLDAFTSIECEQAICGTGYFNGTLRDTDWFTHTVNFDWEYEWHVEAEFEAVIGRVDNGGIDDCNGVSAFATVAVGAMGCEPLMVAESNLPPGTYWFFVAPNFTQIFLCDGDGADYVARLGLLLARGVGQNAFSNLRREHRELETAPNLYIEKVAFQRLASALDQPVVEGVRQQLIGRGERGDDFDRHPAESGLDSLQHRADGGD